MTFLYAIWDIMRELSAWLLLGAFIGGLLHVLVPGDFIKKHLGGNNWWSVIKAAFIGVPMPLCSCAVIPTGIGLKKDGASNGAAISFLISTPQTGVDSITVAAGFLGWPFAIFKVLSAFIMGIIGGQLVNLFAQNVDAEKITETNTGAEPSSCCAPTPEPVEEIKSCCTPAPVAEIKSCCAPKPEIVEPKSCCGPEKNTVKSSKIKQALDFAVNDLLRMIWLWLVIGVILSAGLNYFIDPGSLSDFAWATGIYAMLIMLLISLPLYVCATASVPIAASLIAAGLPTGAALVFLMAGPATNLATIGAIAKAFGIKITALYLGVVIIGSMILGYVFDSVISLNTTEHAHHHHEGGWWIDAAAILLCVCFAYFAITDLAAFIKRKRSGAATASCH